MSVPLVLHAPTDRARAPFRGASLRRFGLARPSAIVVGASTGGPQALTTFLRGMANASVPVPIVVVLHMPPEFVAPMCTDLTRVTGLPVTVAHAGEALQPGHVYLAAGPLHCRIVGPSRQATLAHSDDAPVHFCKPAADILFRSAAQTYGSHLLGVVLTGMGSDGLDGAEAIVAAGGSVVVQDEASSVVWGMPGAVARAGLCAAILPIEAMASVVKARLRGLPVSRS